MNQHPPAQCFNQRLLPWRRPSAKLAAACAQRRLPDSRRRAFENARRILGRLKPTEGWPLEKECRSRGRRRQARSARSQQRAAAAVLASGCERSPPGMYPTAGRMFGGACASAVPTQPQLRPGHTTPRPRTPSGSLPARASAAEGVQDITMSSAAGRA